MELKARSLLARSSKWFLLSLWVATSGACSEGPTTTSTTTSGTTSRGGMGGMGGMGGGGIGGEGGMAGAGGNMACIPGTMVPCYSGPQATLGIGTCKAGVQECNADGSAFGACVGEVLPTPEICDMNMSDENCDGKPGCECGDSVIDPGEDCDDGNTINGDACPADCLRHAFRVAAGRDHTCVILDDGRLKCWGRNNRGQLGVGDTQDRGQIPGQLGDNLPAVDLGTGKRAISIGAGEGLSCALLNDGTVKCWGGNNVGQLGLGDNVDRGDNPGEMGDNLPAIDLGTGKTAIAIGVRGFHACALLSDSTIKCWGGNASGELGQGDTNNRGDNPGEMGDNLLPINLGAGKNAVTLVPGHSHTCALLNDKTMKCWGNNSVGQLGLGDLNYRGDGPGEMGDFLPAIDVGAGKSPVVAGAGQSLTCAILNEGSLKCWGQNTDGQLGQGDTTQRGDNPGEMGDNLPAINLGTGQTAVEIHPMWWAACARLQDGHVKCWGWNGNADLGLGDTNSRGDGPNEMGDKLPTVDLGSGILTSSITGHHHHTCGIVNGNMLKCWGWNYYGHLGLGDKANRGDTPADMGDNLPFVTP